MILNKELLEHGVEEDGFGRKINPLDNYNRSWNDRWWRVAYRLSEPYLHLVQRPWLLAGGPNPQPSDVDPAQPSERASDGDTMPLLP